MLGFAWRCCFLRLAGHHSPSLSIFAGIPPLISGVHDSTTAGRVTTLFTHRQEGSVGQARGELCPAMSTSLSTSFAPALIKLDEMSLVASGQGLFAAVGRAAAREVNCLRLSRRFVLTDNIGCMRNKMTRRREHGLWT
jgi:hypothetical protein